MLEVENVKRLNVELWYLQAIGVATSLIVCRVTISCGKERDMLVTDELLGFIPLVNLGALGACFPQSSRPH